MLNSKYLLFGLVLIISIGSVNALITQTFYTGYETDGASSWRTTGLNAYMTLDSNVKFAGSYGGNVTFPNTNSAVLYSNFSSSINTSKGENISISAMIKYGGMFTGLGLSTNTTIGGNYYVVKHCGQSACGTNGGRIDVYTYGNNTQGAISYSGNSSCPAMSAVNWYNITVYINYWNSTTRMIGAEIRNATSGSLICTMNRSDSTAYTLQSGWSPIFVNDLGSATTMVTDEVRVYEQTAAASPYVYNYTIKGLITYNNTAISGADVLLINATSNTIVANTSTNSTGGYRFGGEIYSAITNNSLWIISSYFRNTTVYYGKTIWVNATVGE